MTQSEPERPRVLCVDDEPHVLAGLERTLGWDFEIVTAPSGQEGLQRIVDAGPFAVVVSDMRMPEMDGATFLAAARERAPETVRLLLTGHADTDAAMAAINQGGIFRFLLKPCEPDTLIQSIRDAAKQHRLRTVEKHLLEHTLGGAVKAMAKLLEIQLPGSFRKAAAMSRYARHVGRALHFEHRWALESAALLSRAGHVTLPGEVLEALESGQPLHEAQQEMVGRAFETAADLLTDIPRMELVCGIIRGLAPGGALPKASATRFGVQVLLAADQLDTLMLKEPSLKTAVAQLKDTPPEIRHALARFRNKRARGTPKVRAVQLDQMRAGMTLEEDVLAKGGMVIARQGSVLTGPMIGRLRNFHQSRGVTQPIRVLDAA